MRNSVGERGGGGDRQEGDIYVEGYKGYASYSGEESEDCYLRTNNAKTIGLGRSNSLCMRVLEADKV